MAQNVTYYLNGPLLARKNKLKKLIHKSNFINHVTTYHQNNMIQGRKTFQTKNVLYK
jgi:hypothetical protein